jgi:hypothetical protein
MSSSTSIGRGPAHGGNENHDGDPRNKTLGETVKQEPPAGNELADDAGPDGPAGVPSDADVEVGTPRPGRPPPKGRNG